VFVEGGLVEATMAPPSLLAHLDASRDSTALSLAYASIGDEGCNAVARFMRENVMLKQLDLRGNNIRADGLVVLAHALRNNANLGSFCMKWNHVGSHQRGVQAFCDVIKENKSVTHVDFRNNKIGPECGAVFASMLKENNTITHIDLSWNDLGAEGGKALLEGIQMNHSVIDCQLSGNRIAEDTLHAIAYILRRNRTSAPLSAVAYKENATVSSAPPPSQAAPMSTSRELDLGATAPQPEGRVIQDEGVQLKLLQKERDYANAEDARFFGETAEYIDQLQLDVARNKKYRMDAEERERVVTKGFMEREMRYAQEMRELENLLAKAKADKDELLQETQYLQAEIERVKQEKNATMQDRLKLEEIARATADRLRCDIRDGLTVKADLETEIYKVKRKQEEQEEENQRLRVYLSRCKEDLDKALR
jgi:hypothetical protein